jgi:hypothetical protein
MVNREMLDGWRNARSHLVPTLDLTPKNTAYSQLRAELDLMREHRIKQGERTMQHGAERLKTDCAKAFAHGRARSAFNQTLYHSM